ncbi:DUF4394 domain-containing protein [Ferrovibrio sp.]|uniref:DUF4394 domain-containing protein n=1 Tax=Ferrovibrio sp. TaxID=1917215 RepID=UPI000CADC14E|nr:DUF4394 domain-containing protein [Ferrovibrio sp.]PJI38027.1 MAG: hypothetical protein CTR53_16890 [Ferrovibrio sp.]
MRIATTAALGAFTLLTASPALALDMASLTGNNGLLLFSDKTPGKTKAVAITGVDGKLLGIDMRPADGKLYALSHDGTLYTVDTASGAATRKSKLSVTLDAIDHLVVDFNPQADRLRVNVDTGQTVVDGKLAYRPQDRNAGKLPGVYAGAYINSYAGATQTQLFDIDSLNGSYVIQDPPNDGVLRSVAPTGAKPGAVIGAIDIYTDAKDEYFGFAVSENRLHRFDVATGNLGKGSAIGNGRITVIDIAVLTPRR